MYSVLLETLAMSTAHGISRAAATQNVPLRVIWILLFLCFLGLFCINSVHLVEKWMNETIVTNIEGKVDFELPDLYFCPMNSISGSYPNTLNEIDADLINEEIGNLSKLYDALRESDADTLNSLYFPGTETSLKLALIFRSLTERTRELLLHRSAQSIFPKNMFFETFGEMVLLESNQLCFKYTPPEFLNEFLKEKGGFIWQIPYLLFTDPYYPHFNYTGHPLNPITCNKTNESVDPHLWDFNYGVRNAMADSGYIMLVVDRDTMPSMSGSKLYLAPGRSYFVSLSMEQVEYSDNLNGYNCSKSNTELEFVNMMNDSKVTYKPSYYGCIFNKYMHSWYNSNRYVLNSYPIPWNLREIPKILNLTENNRFILSLITNALFPDYDYFQFISGSESTECEVMVPCVYRKYSAERLSFASWPSFTGKFAASLKELVGNELTPAFKELMKLAEELDSEENHSAHKEVIFNKFISDSMLKVSIGIDSPRSPRLFISYSYSWQDFLADIGGLLGLYIGCSLLTLCELFELFYQLLRVAVKRGKGTAPHAKSTEDVAKCQDDDAKTVMSTPVVENLA